MKVMTFGEIMLRLKTPEYLKILQADGFEASYGGAESNVAVSLAMFGDEAAYVTKIPDNPVGLAALGAVRRLPPVCSTEAPGWESIILKREPISARPMWFMTGNTVRWRWRMLRSLTGKRS